MKKIVLSLAILLLLLTALPALASCSKATEDAFGFERPKDTWITECLMLREFTVGEGSEQFEKLGYNHLFGTSGESGLVSEKAVEMDGQHYSGSGGLNSAYLIYVIYANTGLPDSPETALDTSLRVSCFNGSDVLHDEQVVLRTTTYNDWGNDIVKANPVKCYGDLEAEWDLSRPFEESLRITCTKESIKKGVVQGAVAIPVDFGGNVEEGRTLDGIEDDALYVNFSVRGFGAKNEIIDEQDIFTLDDHEKHREMLSVSNLSVRYLTESAYNDGDFSDGVLSDTAVFENGTACYAVLDVTVTQKGIELPSQGLGEEMKLVVYVSDRKKMDITVEEAPTSDIKEKSDEGNGTLILTAYGLPSDFEESKTVRMIVRLLPLKDGTAELDFLVVGDTYQAMEGNCLIHASIDTTH